MTPPAAKAHPQVDFDAAVHAVMLERLDGRISAAESHTHQSIQNMTGTLQAMQADVQRIDARSIDNNSLLHTLSERSTGFERLASAVEKNSGLATSVNLELASMRGFVRGVILCGGLALSVVIGFAVYRFDRTDDAINALREVMRIYHPTAVDIIGDRK